MGFHTRTVPLLSFLFLAGFLGCENKTSIGQKAVEMVGKSIPDQVMGDMQAHVYGDEGSSWEMISPEAKMYTSQNLMSATDIKITLYRGGERSTKIKANKASFNINPDKAALEGPFPKTPLGTDLKTGDMFLDGDVVITSTDGARVTSNWMHYQKRVELIYSTGPVKITRDNSVTHGIGFEATSDLASIKIFNETLIIRDEEN